MYIRILNIIHICILSRSLVLFSLFPILIYIYILYSNLILTYSNKEINITVKLKEISIKLSFNTYRFL